MNICDEHGEGEVCYNEKYVQHVRYKTILARKYVYYMKQSRNSKPKQTNWKQKRLYLSLIFKSFSVR